MSKTQAMERTNDLVLQANFNPKIKTYIKVVVGMVMLITIIGIPFAKQHFKLIPIALLPFTYELKS